CGLLLPDSGRLLEEEAAHANRHGYTRHQPAMPLYTEEDAVTALERLRTRDFEETFEVLPGVRARLVPAGHLLGAASVRIEWDGGSLLFSGDLGRDDDLLMRAPTAPQAANTVVIESTTHCGARRAGADAVLRGRACADAAVRLAPA